jgi:hypothetical protein
MAEWINIMKNGPEARALSVGFNASPWPLWASGVRIPLPAPNDILLVAGSENAEGERK